MFNYYKKKALEILREEGLTELSKAGIIFVLIFFAPYSFKFHTYIRHLQNRIRFYAPADPYKIIEIRPSEVNHIGGRGEQLEWKLEKPERGLGRIRKGDWDLEYRTEIENSWIIEGIYQRFHHDMKWENTEYYQRTLKELNRTYRNRQQDLEELESRLKKRFNNIENLFNDIKTNGYKRGHTGSRLVPGSNQPVRDRREVLVVIDRHGKINFFEGNHRFGIARVLNLEIPAQVVCRHKQWQDLRDKIYKNGLSEGHEDLRNHPDLQDVLK